MKPQSRILGIDDAPFQFSDETVPVVGVVARSPAYVEAVMTTRVHVDGTDATEALAAMVQRSRYREGLALVLVDGAALGGFNVVDIDALHAATAIPVATVTRNRPDARAIEAALRARFPDAEARLAILRRKEMFSIETAHKPLYATAAGMPASEVRQAVKGCTLRGALPEPIRMAHIIATALVKGESYGNA